MSMDIQSYLIGHLGIVAGIFDALGIGAVIDRALPKQGSKNLPHSIIIKAVILNGLGFTHQRLYLFPNFFMTLPTEKLLVHLGLNKPNFRQQVPSHDMSI